MRWQSTKGRQRREKERRASTRCGVWSWPMHAVAECPRMPRLAHERRESPRLRASARSPPTRAASAPAASPTGPTRTRSKCPATAAARPSREGGGAARTRDACAVLHEEWLEQRVRERPGARTRSRVAPHA
eukprot:3804822-Pleurochrysis_carterae.AAC.3